MIYFNNDYSEGCHESILARLSQTNLEQTSGYGCDEYCQAAAEKIRTLCGNSELSVHFLVGGTQTNVTVIDAALRPHQGVISADTGHIHVHETGAVEASGHKVLAVPSKDGKLTATQVETVVLEQRNSGAQEHMVQPKLVYISNPTELGTIYTFAELTALSQMCEKYGLYLFMDGARLGYGLEAEGNDITLADLAALCHVFYIGGTKVGALFGEAVVIREKAIAEDYRYFIKQHGGMLAKGRLLGLQFDALLTDGLYFRLGAHGNRMADKIRDTLRQLQVPQLVYNTTNQIFPILSDGILEELSKEFTFSEQGRVDSEHRAVRFCTGWATREENVDKLCVALKNCCKKT